MQFGTVDTDINDKIDNVSEKTDFNFRDYILRWRTVFIIPFSFYVINSFFIYICEVDSLDIYSFQIRSSILLSVAWVSFWVVRFRTKASAPGYIGLYGYIYVVLNFVFMFKSRIAIVGDVFSYSRSGGGWGIVTYASMFSILFLAFSNLLEKENLIDKYLRIKK